MTGIKPHYMVYDEDTDLCDSSTTRERAEEHAKDRSENYDRRHAVMLMVPGPADFPELRCITVFEAGGRISWETDVYDREILTTT